MRYNTQVHTTIELEKTDHALAITEAISVLAAGGLIIFPTETTYGAAVDATNPAAVEKLLAYKSRREGKPLSIAVTSMEMAEQYVELNEQARTLYRQFLPGPVTVVSTGKGVVAAGVESEFGTLGVRIPAYDFVLKLLQAFGKPITATSANGSGKKRPYTIADIFSHISDKQKSLIDLVLDAGTLPKNDPSTVIDTTLSTPIVMRQGELLQTTETQTTLTTSSEAETKDVAGKLLLKHWNAIKETGVIIGLTGPLGAGKTVFAKGAAQFLQIAEPVTSPTYSYIEEYEFSRHGVSGKLFHLDMWKVEDAATFERLGVHELCQPNTVVLIEWWNLVAEYMSNGICPVLAVDITDNQITRTLKIGE